MHDETKLWLFILNRQLKVEKNTAMLVIIYTHISLCHLCTIINSIIFYYNVIGLIL